MNWLKARTLSSPEEMRMSSTGRLTSTCAAPHCCDKSLLGALGRKMPSPRMVVGVGSSLQAHPLSFQPLSFLMSSLVAKTWSFHPIKKPLAVQTYSTLYPPYKMARQQLQAGAPNIPTANRHAPALGQHLQLRTCKELQRQLFCEICCS